MSVRPLLLFLLLLLLSVDLSVSSLAFAQGQQSAQGQQQQAAPPKPTPTATPAAAPTPTPPPPTVVGVFTYQKDKLCFGGSSEHPKCEAGIGNRVIVQVKDFQTNTGTVVPPSELVLFLDGQPIKGNPGMPVSDGGLIPIPSPDPKLSLLEFQLNRTDASRPAWTSLLGSPSLTQSRRSVSLSVGKPDAQPFAYSDPNNKPHIELRSYYRGWFFGMLLVMIAAVVVFIYLARTTNIIRDSNPPNPPERARKPYSLALTQAALWFFLVFGSFLFIALVTGDYNSTITEQALVLIGIGTGTALGAAMIDSTKRGSANAALSTLEPKQAQLQEEANQLQAKIASLSAAQTDADKQAFADANVQLKGVAVQLTDTAAQIEEAKSGLTKPVSDGFPRDLLTDVDGVNFHRFQMVVWTIILGFFFLNGVYRELAMPQFSATLLALMGISAGTYLGFKIPEKQS
jgi:hypothetical protein